MPVCIDFGLGCSYKTNQCGTMKKREECKWQDKAVTSGKLPQSSDKSLRKENGNSDVFNSNIKEKQVSNWEIRNDYNINIVSFVCRMKG